MRSYIKSIDWIRVVACLSILFYHLNLFPMGYLAVCSFLVISGYLTTKNALEDQQFSFKKFYLQRFFRLYLPVIVITFLTLFLISFFPNLSWQNLKPETTSIILGYNNFWQLSANLNYFTKTLSSPFIHFWYIALLLQFDLIFPLFFSFFKKLGEKVHHRIPSILTLILAFCSFFFFFTKNISGEEMFSYYHTLTRVFSLLFGVSLGFQHFYEGALVPKWKNVWVHKVIFFGYFFLLLCFYLIPIFSESIEMLLVTILTCRLLDYGTFFQENQKNHFDRFIQWFCSISFEIYCIQYPVIYCFQFISMNSLIKLCLEIFIILVLSFCFSFLFRFSSSKGRNLRTLFLCILLPLLCYGAYTYLITKDYTNEIKAFELELSLKEQEVLKKQEAYLLQKKEEETNYQNSLDQMMKEKENIDEIVKNISLVGIGDSVMLGAIDALYEMFPNGYFDAQISRTAWVVQGILNDLKTKNLLSDTILLNLGVNGDCSMECKEDILNTLQEKNVFWINIPESMDLKLHVNEKLEDLQTRYENLTIIDWNSFSKDHPEYFRADHVHLTNLGIEAYTKIIYEAISKKYQEIYEQEQARLMEEYEEKNKTKITFLGNDLLLNIYEELESLYPSANFVFQKDASIARMKEELEQNDLNYQLVFLFDSKVSFSEKDYRDLFNLYKDHQVSIYSFSSGSNIVDLSQEFTKEDYLADQIHLNQNGNQKLIRLIQEKFPYKISSIMP